MLADTADCSSVVCAGQAVTVELDYCVFEDQAGPVVLRDGATMKTFGSRRDGTEKVVDVHGQGGDF